MNDEGTVPHHVMEVVGVRVEMPSNQPIILLKEVDGVRYLPIWVGAVEATAIAFAQQEVNPPRPLTHDLIRALLSAAHVELKVVTIDDLRDGIFYAALQLSNGESLSARPSDAIAIALRTGSPILATEPLLASAGIEIPESSQESNEAEVEVERFREFLDQINPEDFAG